MKVISLGGSIIVPDKIDIDFLKKFKKLILKQKEKVIIVCGGGRTAREYIKAASNFTKDRAALDKVGIESTVLNAQLVKTIFGKHTHKDILHKAKKILFKKILIAASDKPGSTSDYDTAVIAKNYGIKEIINLSNIDYVYSKDPKLKGAERLKNLTWRQYFKIIGTKAKSGGHYPFDPVASKIAQKYKLTLKHLDGRNLKEVEKCLSNKEFKGTIIS